MSQNPRITKRDKALIKGDMRRAFARSELHRRVLDRAQVEHYDPKRPRVKRWCRCAVCSNLDARSYMAVDHIDPVIKLDSCLEEMTLQELADRLWCIESNLQAICKSCHCVKTKGESSIRRDHKRRVKNERQAV